MFRNDETGFVRRAKFKLLSATQRRENPFNFESSFWESIGKNAMVIFEPTDI